MGSGNRKNGLDRYAFLVYNVFIVEKGDVHMKYTSAAANKLIRRLNDDKEFYLQKEQEAKAYVAAVDETPVIPEFDYAENARQIEEIDDRIARLKHAVNVHNALARIDVGGEIMSVDEILVRMAQLNQRQITLDEMRKTLPKQRVESGYGTKTIKPEYRYINYDLELVRKDYEHVSSTIIAMQLALDKYNQTVEFEAEE